MIHCGPSVCSSSNAWATGPLAFVHVMPLSSIAVMRTGRPSNEAMTAFPQRNSFRTVCVHKDWSYFSEQPWMKIA